MAHCYLAWMATCLIVLWTNGIFGDSQTWRSGPPEGLPELTKLSVDCGKEEMTINLEFSSPYDGSIYSKSNGQSHRCVHVAPHSRITEATFTIEYDSCGTRSDPQGKYYENTIIIQYDDIVIEAWDEAKKIRCEWHDGYEKSAYKMPITISDLDVVEMNFQGDDVDCWLEVQDGKGPWSAKVEGLVPLGSPLTLVVAIQDSEGQFDMRVKSCIAHDGQKHPIHLTDEEGCVLRPKMMSPFQKTTETKGTASVIAYSHFYAFKFPETVEVTIQCTVEICRHGCPGSCQEGREFQIPESTVFKQPTLKEDDIPTYKDSHPFSTVVTSRPDEINQTLSLNVSSSEISSERANASKEETDPLKSSSNTNYNYFMHYPYDLFEDLAATDRQDKDDYADKTHQVNNYDSSNTDDVYYSQSTNLFKGKEHGKHFPPSEIIQDVRNISSEENISEIIIQTTTSMSFITETQDATSIPNLSDSQALQLSDENNAQSSTLPTDIEELNLRSFLDSDPIEKLDNTEYNGSIVFSDKLKNDSEVERKEEKDELYLATTVTASTLESGRSELNGEITESNDYNDAFSDSKEGMQDYESRKNKKVMEITVSNRHPNDYFEDYKISGRHPEENYESLRHQIHYHSHMPPVPVPPLTLYNGVPLYYYGKTDTKGDVLSKERYPYLSMYPYQKEYVKSKLRRPGRRRGRRDIGENEQLGLQQTLRVIAPSDLDFNIKDKENTKPLYVGKNDANLDVCIAPSSFAAGLGLLLLANICVLCVVVFLGYHYYLNKKSTVKAIELLDTEIS
ncbi:uncharacterized protein [Parasteatoda tepidariorum]|uniref:uncharacterized protein n=1 Tax=Parasteatoda tepidariorum TaxID=114398 RepID=UPI00077FD84F|nr:uncharacterized protein LOC107440132 [Parasteatoda tepidariorum]